MQTPLLENEQVIKDGGANLLKVAEHVGGHLYLTNMRLIFESHLYNIQTGITILDLKDIIKSETAWTKFLGIIPLAHNSVNVTAGDGTVYSFVVWGGKEWNQMIGKR